MKPIIINPGPISSFNSLNYYLGPKFNLVRDAYKRGYTPEIRWDFTQLQFEKISISGLTAFLSLARRLREFVGYPIPVILRWDPILQGSWYDLGFFEIADRFDIFAWPKEYIGGFTRGKHNRNTKLLFFADVNPRNNYESLEDVVRIKRKLKQKISPNFFLRVSELFEYTSSKLENLAANAAIELIVNSLVHAEDVAFVGLRKSITTRRITICVCDTGVGFLSSLRKTFGDSFCEPPKSHIQALIIGSLIQKKEHGLRLAINDVLHFSNLSMKDMGANEGWVNISSYDCEIRWQKRNWVRAKTLFDEIDITEELPDPVEFLGDHANDFLAKPKLWQGYWKKYDSYLVGTRISFEINY